MNDQKKWTFMVYLAGDNNLSDAGETDLAEMAKVGSTEDVNIIAEFDCVGDEANTKRFFIKKEDIQEVEDLGKTDSGDPNTLLDFIKWGADTYPAERYGLILWNHGSGWAPSEIDAIATEVNTKEYGRAEGSERSASSLGRTFFRTSLKEVLSLETINERAICSDDGSGHSLDTIELGKVLEAAMKTLNKPLDILGMDACLMSNIEVAFQVQDYVNYIVASEENEPFDGWPYDHVLDKLVKEPNIESSDLCSHIVDVYIKSYKNKNYTVTQSAFNLAHVKTVSKSLDQLAQALRDHMETAYLEIWNAQRQSAKFWHNTLWDIIHFCNILERGTTSEAIQKACQAVTDVFKIGSNNFIIAESHRGKKVKNCGGVTIYLCPPPNSISRFYADLEFAKDHYWDEMLEDYHSIE